MSLSYSERLILANQYAILEQLDGGNACRNRNAREIVDGGYEYLYDTLKSAGRLPSSGRLKALTLLTPTLITTSVSSCAAPFTIGRI